MEELNNNPMTPTNERSSGPVVGVVIIILVLVVGALYFWGAKLNKEQIQGAEKITNNADPVANSLRSQSQSDDLDSIQVDLQNTDLNSLDSDMENIDNELDQPTQ